jgi:hypothetical protein
MCSLLTFSLLSNAKIFCQRQAVYWNVVYCLMWKHLVRNIGNLLKLILRSNVKIYQGICSLFMYDLFSDVRSILHHKDLSDETVNLINKNECVSVCLCVSGCMYFKKKRYILLPCFITIGYIMYWIYCCTTVKTSTVIYIVEAVGR